MPLERTRRCKVNINFSNFETIAVNLFHDPLEIGLRDLWNLGQLIHAVKSAEPLPVSCLLYTSCKTTGKLIPKERLMKVPHATECIEAKEGRIH